ncbi:sugar ABC transporter substrate-binding protein [Photobacterium aquae]|uniref:Probable sugar-binding periplasmic protein n=1 Tax=Photobacterium aquae TaxID=1195763 RepID=A0A0J1H6C0_9GAMM|nr:ABC transporter substrate-binding protein [Photobacterium aquae]KLV07270.1 sugar ABC transporter substrate-binding protein [Photobacterium aquae]
MKTISWLILISTMYVSVVHAQQELQFLHWWTSKGEVDAANEVAVQLGKHDIVLASVAVPGGGGKMAKSILQARAIAGNPPDMVQLEGPAIKSWAALGFLHNVNPVANEAHWDRKLPLTIRDIHKLNNEYVALPVTIHRLNWLWIHTPLLKRLGLSVPQTWPQVVKTFKVVKQRGIAPLAMGNEPWQVVQLFENIAFGLGGPSYYRKAFIEMDEATLTSQITYDALTIFRQISEIVLPDMTKQRWEEATRSLMAGERVFQISGDWVAGELMALNGEFPSFIQCHVAPAYQSGFIYNIDSFAFFKKPTFGAEQALAVANLLSDPHFLSKFNQRKGSIPAFRDVSVEGFNSCSLKARDDFLASEKTGTLMPSIIDSMAVSSVIEKAVSSELFRFFNDPSMTPDDVILHMQNVKVGMHM